MKLLIIIDMQKGFLESIRFPLKDRLIKNISSVISKNSHDHILFVELCPDYYGETIYDIKRLANKYNIIQKLYQDGSSEIIDWMKRSNISPKKISICGVFSDQCVFDTAVGLCSRTNIPVNFLKHCSAKKSTVPNILVYKKLIKLSEGRINIVTSNYSILDYKKNLEVVEVLGQ